VISFFGSGFGRPWAKAVAQTHANTDVEIRYFIEMVI
jgi:hypothetical protein